MSLNIGSLPNYERYNPFQRLDPGGPHENSGVLHGTGVSHLAETAASLLYSHAGSSTIPTPGIAVSLNPQPLPPREMLQASWLNPGLLVSLNPQPLPPEPPEQNLWESSAVLTGGADVGMFPPGYHGPTPDPAPWTAGIWLR